MRGSRAPSKRAMRRVLLIVATVAGCSAASVSSTGEDPSRDVPPATPAQNAQDGAQSPDAHASAPLDASTHDASPDAALLACPPPALPTSACASGVASTFTVSSQTTTGINTSVSSIRVRFDKGGFLHAAWSSGANVVYYMTNRSGTLTFEQVAGPKGVPNELVDSVRLAIDDCGRPQILYQRGSIAITHNGHRIFLATKLATGWSEEELTVPKSPSDATPADDYDQQDLVVDAAGSPTVLFTRYFEAKITILERAGAAWTAETLPMTVGSIGGIVAATSPTLGLVVSYQDNVAGRPAVAWKSAGAWVPSVFTSGAYIDSFGSSDEPNVQIAVAPDGSIHLAYVSLDDADNRTMHYAHIGAAGGFSPDVSVPMPTTSKPYGFRLMTTPGGDVRLVFDQLAVHTGKNRVAPWLSTMTSGSFSTPVPVPVVPASSLSCNTGSAIDGNGRLHVVEISMNEPIVVQTQDCKP
jgi:hypothetical protein